MAQVAEHQFTRNTQWELTEQTDPDPEGLAFQSTEESDSDKSEVAENAAMNKMKMLARRIYESTPGINESKYKRVFFNV